MALFNKKAEKKPEFFIRVMGEDWIEVAKMLRSKKYNKHEIRIEDDVACVDGEKPTVKIYFDGNINDYVNCLVDLALQKNIVQIEEDEKEEVESK